MSPTDIVLGKRSYVTPYVSAFFRGFRQFRGSLSSPLCRNSRCPRTVNPRSASRLSHPARADRRRLVEQPVFFLLPGQPGEFGHELVPGRKERFLAVERSSRFLRVLGDIANKGSLVLGLQTDILHLRKEPLNV